MSTSTSTRRRTMRRPSLQSLSVARSLPVDSDAAAAPRAHFSRAVGPTKKKKSSSVGTWPLSQIKSDHKSVLRLEGRRSFYSPVTNPELEFCNANMSLAGASLSFCRQERSLSFLNSFFLSFPELNGQSFHSLALFSH